MKFVCVKGWGSERKENAHYAMGEDRDNEMGGDRATAKTGVLEGKKRGQCNAGDGGKTKTGVQEEKKRDTSVEDRGTRFPAS